jgi:tRNA A-37 threonylcarbamoyl transferase component Bud32
MEARHRLLVELGRGGMGTVYLALAQGPAGFNKLKVVKHLSHELAEDFQFLNMFMDEARLAARLNHPNIVQTNEVGFDGRNYFIEMEYLEGETLESLTRRANRTGGLPTELGLHILAQALAGLHYAHELTDHDGMWLEIIHRDVSPPNIFVTHEGAVKILDFGIAKTTDSSSETRTGVVRGKLKYMAPERAARGKVDRRVDVFAVGVILWQLLTGRRLYEGLAEEEILKNLRTGQIPRPKSIRPDVPDGLDALCARALATRPEDRIATAAEFQIALEEYVHGTGLVTGPRQVAELMGKLFADRRAAMAAEIDGHIRASSGRARIRAPVPLLAQADAIRATATGPSDVALDVRSGPPHEPTQSIPPSQALGLPETTGQATAEPSLAHRLQPSGLPRYAVMTIVALGAAAALVFGVQHRPTTSAGPIAPLIHCATRADCLASTSKDFVCAPGGVCKVSSGCTTNVGCAAATGHPALCNDRGQCVPFETDDCHVSAEPGNVDDDETLWFGVIMPQRGSSAEAFGKTVTNSIDLARRDFMSSTNGLPSRHLGRAPRPIGLVVCDDSNLNGAGIHLADDLHVPAIIGFGGPTELLTIAPSLLFVHDVLAVEAYSSNALITSVPGPPGQPRLLWRTTGSAANEGTPLAAVVARLLEPKTNASGTGETPRVALVRHGNAASFSVAESFISHLHLGSHSVADEVTSFHQYVFRPEEASSVVDQLLAFRPAIIVSINDGFAETIASPLEAKWTRENGPPPLYLFDGTMGPDAFRFLARDADRRHRYFSVDFPANTETNLKFALRYNEFFSPKITPGTAPGVAYDALYVLVYASAAVGDEPITGSALSRGIGQLVPPGVPIDVGGASTYKAFGALRAGQSIDLNGAGTPLDFDLGTGETRADYAVYCAHTDARGNVDDAMESGMRYSAKKGALDGEMRCP